MIAGALVPHGGGGNNEAVFYFVIVQHSAGAEQDKFFCTHGDNFFKTGHTGRSTHPGKVKCDFSALVWELIDRSDSVGGV